jgi:hypothetical protein
MLSGADGAGTGGKAPMTLSVYANCPEEIEHGFATASDRPAGVVTMS